MKKIFFAALAAVALTACVADVVTEEPTYAIDFVSSAQGTVKTTVVTSDNLETFKVFAFNNETAEKTNTIMNDQTVNKVKGVWTYTPKKYWPLVGDVDFYGIAGVTTGYSASAENGLTYTITMPNSVAEVNAATIPDVVYATAIGKTKGDGNPAVEMAFRHAMAQIDFKIKNTTTAGGITVMPINVSVDDLAANGTYTTPTRSTSLEDKTITGSWRLGVDPYTADPYTYTYLFNSEGVTINADGIEVGILSPNESAKCMALPQAKDVTFQVKCKIWQNGVLIFDDYKTASTSIDWKEGHKYTYTFNFNDKSIEDNTIEFTAAVTPIVDGTTSPVGTPATPATPAN